MNICMAGIDYTVASVAQREPFSLTAAGVGRALRAIGTEPGVLGCVLLSTCNRTELYLSCPDGETPDPALLLCRALGMGREMAAPFVRRSRQAAVTHLMMVSAGLRSQILGEDQIITQVRAAMDMAIKEEAADACLATLFRLAVTAGKKVRTNVRFSRGASAAHAAVEALAAEAPLEGKRALVIGNGEMGRLAARLLLEHGCDVTVTLRSYRHGTAAVPPGCDAVPYDDRYTAIPCCSILVSATASPHCTVTAEGLGKCGTHPTLLVDLAVPRDIEPAVAGMAGVRLWNMDDLGSSRTVLENREPLLQARAIITGCVDKLDQWARHREALATPAARGVS